jgi:uncharacterized membrane protein
MIDDANVRKARAVEWLAGFSFCKGNMPRAKIASISRSKSGIETVDGPKVNVMGRGKAPSVPSININYFVTESFLIVVVLVLASVFVRLYNLDKQSLECDEVYTISAANGQQYVYFNSQSRFRLAHFPTTIEEYNRLLTPQLHSGVSDVNDVLRRNVQMPLYFYVMHYWLKLVGTSEWALRFPSVFFGTLTVLMIFLLGKEMFNPSIAFTAALLTALMPEQIYFSQQARAYPLLMLLTVIATYSLILAQRGHSSIKPYLLFFVASVSGLYTHYLYIFCITAHALYIWMASSLGRRHWRAWLLTFIGIAVTLTPWLLLVSLTQRETSSGIIAWAHDDLIFGSLKQRVISNIAGIVAVPEAPFGLLTVVVAYGFILLGIISLRFDRLTLWLLCSSIALPMAGILAMDITLNTHGIIMVRYWMVITPALHLLMACGIDQVIKLGKLPVWRTVAVVILTVFGGWAAIGTAQGKIRAKPDSHRDLAQFLQESIKDPNDEFIMTEGLNSIPLAIAYYSRGAPQRQIDMVSLNWAIDPANKQQLRAVMLPRKNVWLVISGRSKGGSMLKNTGYQLYEDPRRFGHISVFHYRRSDSSQMPAEAK